MTGNQLIDKLYNTNESQRTALEDILLYAHKRTDKKADEAADELAALRTQNAALLAAPKEIENQCDSAMGEWSAVVPPHLPANIENIYDVRDTARAAIEAAESEKE